MADPGTVNEVALRALANFKQGYKDARYDPLRRGEAIIELRYAASLGLAEAQTMLGLLYAAGDGVEKAEAEACKWWDKAATSGDPEAMYWLAEAFENGRGTPPNRTLAFHHYRRATELGHERALAALIRMYGERSAASPTGEKARVGLATEDEGSAPSVPNEAEPSHGRLIPVAAGVAGFGLALMLLGILDDPITYRGRRAWLVRLVREAFGDFGVNVLMALGASFLIALAADALFKRVRGRRRSTPS